VPLAVCATPIGNLEDVTLRVLRELAEADVVLCEDTRRTRILLDRHGITARTLSYHEHNEAARTAELLPRLQAGERLALVSDAGLPGISDPGARLVRRVRQAGFAVVPIPGASAVTAAVSAAGVPEGRFLSLLKQRSHGRAGGSGNAGASGSGPSASPHDRAQAAAVRKADRHPLDQL